MSEFEDDIKEDGNATDNAGHLYVPVGNTVDLCGYRVRCHNDNTRTVCTDCDLRNKVTPVNGICLQLICADIDRQAINATVEHELGIHFKIVKKLEPDN